MLNTIKKPSCIILNPTFRVDVCIVIVSSAIEKTFRHPTYDLVYLPKSCYYGWGFLKLWMDLGSLHYTVPERSLLECDIGGCSQNR